MRINGTNYPTIEKLPAKAMPVSMFASASGMAVGYVYIKYKRHFEPAEGKQPGTHPGYVIRCYQGTNYVIPD